MAAIEASGQVFSEQPGRFILLSSNGNKYMLVLYDYDSNAILVDPMKSRRTADILNSYKPFHARLCTNCAPEHLLIVHQKPVNRDSWEPHAMEGWYIGPALHG